MQGKEEYKQKAISTFYTDHIANFPVCSSCNYVKFQRMATLPEGYLEKGGSFYKRNAYEKHLVVTITVYSPQL